MSPAPAEVARIAQLARLSLSPDAADRMRDQMNDFFAIVEQISAVNTQGIEPLAHPVDVMRAMSLRLRSDLATEDSSIEARSANQRSAPAVEDGLFLVPKVIE